MIQIGDAQGGDKGGNKGSGENVFGRHWADPLQFHLIVGWD